MWKKTIWLIRMMHGPHIHGLSGRYSTSKQGGSRPKVRLLNEARNGKISGLPHVETSPVVGVYGTVGSEVSRMKYLAMTGFTAKCSVYKMVCFFD